MSLEHILSVDFEIPEGWINQHLTEGGGQGQRQVDGGLEVETGDWDSCGFTTIMVDVMGAESVGVPRSPLKQN